MRWFHCIALCMLSALSLAAAEDRPWLGITLETSGGFDARVVIRSVKPESTAAEMGLKKGDILSDISKDQQTWPVKGIDDIKTALNKINVGDEIRIGIERDNNAMTLKGMVKARPSAGGLKDSQQLLTEKVKELNQLKGNSNTNAALALSLHQLGKTLDQLPEKIEEAAREFKEVYPDGEFVIKVEISISSNNSENKTDDAAPGTEENGSDTDKQSKEVAPMAQQDAKPEGKPEKQAAEQSNNEKAVEEAQQATPAE